MLPARHATVLVAFVFGCATPIDLDQADERLPDAAASGTGGTYAHGGASSGGWGGTSGSAGMVAAGNGGVVGDDDDGGSGGSGGAIGSGGSGGGGGASANGGSGGASGSAGSGGSGGGGSGSSGGSGGSTTSCNPLSPQSSSGGYQACNGSETCVPAANQIAECVSTGNVSKGFLCATHSACKPGLGCAEPAPGIPTECITYCSGSSQCNAIGYPLCKPFSPALYAGTVQIGHCAFQ